MSLKISELVSIILAALTAGMFGGPWAALTRSIATFSPEIFLAVVQRLNRNMAQVMTVLMPASLASILPVLWLSFYLHRAMFILALTAFALFIVALVVTMVVEVPIVHQIVTWTVPTLPASWQQLRDRWARFHIIRVVASLAGLILLVAGAIF